MHTYVPGIVLSTLWAFNPIQCHEAGTVIIPISQMREMKHREVKSLAYGTDRCNKWWRQVNRRQSGLSTKNNTSRQTPLPLLLESRETSSAQQEPPGTLLSWKTSPRRLCQCCVLREDAFTSFVSLANSYTSAPSASSPHCLTGHTVGPRGTW